MRSSRTRCYGLPAATAVIVNLIVFLWMFRQDIPSRFSMEVAPHRSDDDDADDAPKRLTRTGMILVGILIGLAAAPFFQWPLSTVAVIGAAIIAGVDVVTGHLRPRKIVSNVSWDLLPFVFSLFLVLRGVSASGWAKLIETAFVGDGIGDSFFDMLTVASVAAFGSNVMNNLPMLLVAVDSLVEPIAAGRADMSAMYAALLGANLGPNLTVIGSLATMLSLSIIGKRGLHISGMRYLKIGLVTVPVLLLAATFGLWIALKIF